MWELETTGTREACQIFGVQIFDYTWSKTNQSVEVQNKLNGAWTMMPVYTVEINGKTLTFVAGELDNGTYGFYLWREEKSEHNGRRHIKLWRYIVHFFDIILHFYFVWIFAAIAVLLFYSYFLR